MKYFDERMKLFLKKEKDFIESSNLDERLENFLHNCFLEQPDCIFFVKQYVPTYGSTCYKKSDIEGDFLDFSGFEVSTNRIHIGQYTNEDIYIQAFVFLKAFKKTWKKQFKSTPCLICIGFQDDEVGKFATFTFHKKREDEEVFDIENIESYLNPIYVEIF